MTQDVLSGRGYLPFIISDAGSDAASLREQMDETGYLFFKGLVAEDVVLQVRRAVLEILQAAGWLAPGSELLEGIANPGRAATTEGEPEYLTVYRQILRLPVFHNFPTNAALMAIAQKLLAGEVMVHPRRIGRITFPGSVKWTTPAHQDFHYIRGAVETYSCWVPLGACPTELGGLAIWAGSHKQGFIEHTEQHIGAVGGRGVPVDESQAVWHSGDFGSGDALFFRSYTIHKAQPNLTKDRLRLSTDNRYQCSKDEIEAGALRPHFS